MPSSYLERKLVLNAKLRLRKFLVAGIHERGFTKADLLEIIAKFEGELDIEKLVRHHKSFFTRPHVRGHLLQPAPDSGPIGYKLDILNGIMVELGVCPDVFRWGSVQLQLNNLTSSLMTDNLDRAAGRHNGVIVVAPSEARVQHSDREALVMVAKGNADSL